MCDVVEKAGHRGLRIEEGIVELMVERKALRGAILIVGGVLTALVSTGVAATTASASQATGEGSVSDTQNISNAAVSDASASPGDLMPLAIAKNIEAGYGGCGGGFTRPREEASTSSPTDEGITADLFLKCNGWNEIQLNFYIQRSRWYGWQNLTHQSISGDYDNYTAHLSPHTNCRAGTWSYRSEVTGGWDGSYDNETHSPSLRTTCVDSSNLNYVDLN